MKPFVPTHKLKDDIPALRLKKGLLLRQINPFATGYYDHRLMKTERDWYEHASPWILTEADLEELLDCEKIMQEMRNEILK